MTGLADRVAIVTGASSGIGRAVADQLAEGGATVVCAARRPDELARTVDEITAAGGIAWGIPTDVADDAAVDRLVTGTIERYGRLDLAFNNAGVPGHGRVTDLDVADFDRIMAVNLRGVFSCLKHEITAMLETGGGAIVNCGSAAGHRGVPNKSAYAASKWALVGLSKSAALDYAGQGVRINVVSPGAVHTALLDRVQDDGAHRTIERSTPMHRIADPDECAAAVVWLLSDAASYVTGAVLNVDGGVSAGYGVDAGSRG